MHWNEMATARPVNRINNAGIKRDVVVIGASAGGVMALKRLFAAFPPNMPAAVGVVLHRGREKGKLAEVLGRRSPVQALPGFRPVIDLTG
jgi:chemotaxis response regulator CheB